MPLDLHQRLSEFSYGYGVTREVEQHLRSVGLRPTPFIPSLLHEAELGADVIFDRPGVALLIQFKLGEELQQFRRTAYSTTIPVLERPFWRFNIDTAAPDGQYDLLLKAEQSDAEVYYVAPRFANWNDYATAFQNKKILEQSLLMRPSQIDSALTVNGLPDGWHRIVYDSERVYVCSEPIEVVEVEPQNFAEGLRKHIQDRSERVDAALKRVFESFDQRREVRKPTSEEPEGGDERRLFAAVAEQIGRSPEELAIERRQRLETFQGRAKSDADAMFAAVGIETWSSGSQLLAVTLQDE